MQTYFTIDGKSLIVGRDALEAKLRETMPGMARNLAYVAERDFIVHFADIQIRGTRAQNEHEAAYNLNLQIG